MPDNYNGTVQIGRYTLQLTDILARQKCLGLLARILRRAERVTLRHGFSFYLNRDEAALLEEKIQFHNAVIETYAMARSLGLKG